jgi:hypothetical protein
MAATSGTTITGTAGAVVAPSPSVIVRDQNGSPFAGATVTFAVQSGGGSVSTASVVTDASGLASASWTLGKTAGANVLNATSGTLSVTFTATGEAGPAALLVVSTGNNQNGSSGTPVPIPPAVIVQDANGNLKSGTVVTFTVGSGGGSVTGATPASNAAGIATVGSWTLGPNPGVNTLVASIPGASPITFTAVAANAKCSLRVNHPFGTTTQGALEADDCQFSDGTFLDLFTTTLPEANAYFFKQTSSAFNSYILLALSDGTVIAENDNESASTQNATIKALLPPGTYILGANSLNPGATGGYSISSSFAPQSNSNCELMFTVKGVTTSQTLQTTDCVIQATPPIYADGFFILLQAGQSITIQMTSSSVDSFLQLVRNNGTLVAQNDNRDATTQDAQITFTATVTDYYAIFTRTAVPGQTGAYTLAIQ